MSHPTKPLRVLVLHGHFQNTNVLRSRMAGLIKQCGKAIEFVIPNAPHIMRAADLTSPGPNSDLDEGLDPMRAWHIIPQRFDEIEESVAFLRDLLKEEKFDGVFGFSQGGAMATLLSALKHPRVYPPFLVNSKPPHPPFKFCVSVSGYQLPGPLSALAFSAGYKTHTLHIIGRNDTIINEERSYALAKINYSKYRRIQVHDGGHFIPTKTSWRRFMCNWMSCPETEWPSPTMVPVSPIATQPPSLPWPRQA